jgi:hypothetical protein
MAEAIANTVIGCGVAYLIVYAILLADPDPASAAAWSVAFKAENRELNKIVDNMDDIIQANTSPRGPWRPWGGLLTRLLTWPSQVVGISFSPVESTHTLVGFPPVTGSLTGSLTGSKGYFDDSRSTAFSVCPKPPGAIGGLPLQGAWTRSIQCST